MLLLPDWFQIPVMKPFHAKSTVEQLAAHLRDEIVNGGMGGVGKSVGQLGVGTQKETLIRAESIEGGTTGPAPAPKHLRAR